MILVTAAGGKTGRTLLPRLARRGEPVRALRRSDRLAELQAIGAREVLAGDILEPAVRERALAGIRAVFHVGPAFHPRETEMGLRLIDAAAAAGVERFVYCSVIHPHLAALVNHRAKLPVEEHLIESGLDWTILQPMHYMQNVRVADAVRSGVLHGMHDLRTRLSHVDLADVADVAAKVLSEPGHSGATYELCGNDHLSTLELADILARESGKPVRAERLAVDALLASGWAREPGDYERDGLRRLCEYYGRHGILGNPNVLAWLLGRAPTRFAAYVRRELQG